MAAQQNGQALDAARRQDGLRQRLRRSQHYMTLFGLGLLLIMLAATLWARAHTLRLAHLHAPTARASALALSGIDRTLAALRGWVLLGDPGFKKTRAQAWSDVVWPALDELNALSLTWEQAENLRRLRAIRGLLNTLHGVQWWIEDVAQTPGNWPARDIAERVSQPAGDMVYDAMTALMAMEMEQILRQPIDWPLHGRADAADAMEPEMDSQQAAERQHLAPWMVDASRAFTRARAAFRHLVNHADDTDASLYRGAIDDTQSSLAALQRHAHLLRQPQREQLARAQHGLRAYDAFAGEALALLQSGPRNVANDLLVSEAAPLARQASSILQAISASQGELMRRDTRHVTLITNLSLGLSLALIAAMVIISGALARRATARIMQPVTALLRATQQLAAGELSQDIPVRSDDALGQLTASFNAMRASLQRSRELDANNQLIRETFGRYVSDEVAARVLDDPSGLHFGGETRHVTMLMADLRGFTALTERLTPQQALAFLNRYLERMVDTVMAYDGDIDEILGDGIFVVFGAPIQRPDDARRAVACAVSMQLAIHEMNGQQRLEGLPEMDMGIAIHTGDVVVGNIGSQRRTKYAAVGSHVNLTSRIESYTIGGQILISENTRRAIPSLLQIQGHMKIEPKGVSEPLTVYDIRGIDGSYNLHLPAVDEPLATLDAAISLRYSVLEEKFVGRTVFQGQLVKLSAKGGQIDASWPAPPLSNLKIWLVSDNGDDVPGELYAKVIDTPHGADEGFEVRFTSVSPAASAYLQQVLDAAKPPTSA